MKACGACGRLYPDDAGFCPVDGTALTSATQVPVQGDANDPRVGQLFCDRYQIRRVVADGGMGRVYEALDIELDERVALKVLRSGLSETALERFRREVRLTRRIQHRNVARMFDIGEYKGEKFLTMELVEGEPLTRSIGPQMAWARLKAIAEQMCAGLTAAHQAGVVHRDLKPDNVLVERGTDRIVITDFGIARGGDDPAVTQVGAVVGTPRYMAPEQLQGGEVDSRADLFSLGVILFELSTGHRPWPGDNAVAIAVSQATLAPGTIDPASTQVPAAFAAVVAACLQLEPGARPANARDVGEAIASGVAPVVPRAAPTRQAKPTKRPPVVDVEPTSLAVLPMACAPGDEYLADGLQEDVTDTLSTTPGLRVRPSGAVRQATAPDPRALGERLQVDHVVVGTMRRTPNGLRVTTRLISVADGFQIWASKRDCGEAEVFEVSEELARGIAIALSTRASTATKPTDPRAVELYLRARAELRRFWGSHVQVASRLLEQAVEYAPTSAPILGAYAYASVQTWVMRAEAELLPRAEQALERGLALGHGEAYLASAQFHFNRSDPERGARDLGKALARAPMSGQTHELAGKILAEVAGTAEARQHYETARGLDPSRSAMIDGDLLRLDALDRDWDQCDARVARLLADPDQALQQLGVIAQARMQAWRGNTEALLESTSIAMQRLSVTAGSIFRLIGMVYSEGAINRAYFERSIRQPRGPDLPLRQLLVRMQIYTEIACLLDQPDLAFMALERVVEDGLLDVTWIDSCPLLEKLATTDHQRFIVSRKEVVARARRVLDAFGGIATGA